MPLTTSKSIKKKSMILPPSEGYTVKILEKFCELTSLHGFAFLNNANSIAVKLVWVFAIIAMMGVGTQFLVNNTEAYLNSRLVTNIESSTANLSVSILGNITYWYAQPEPLKSNFMKQNRVMWAHIQWCALENQQGKRGKTFPLF